MTEAYVLINVALGHEEEVIELLRHMHGVSMVNGVFGAYDIVVKVHSDDTLNMRSLITENIRKIEHIRSTLALMIIEEQSSDSETLQ